MQIALLTVVVFSSLLAAVLVWLLAPFAERGLLHAEARLVQQLEEEGVFLQPFLVRWSLRCLALLGLVLLLVSIGGFVTYLAFLGVLGLAGRFGFALYRQRQIQALAQSMPDLCDLLGSALRSGLSTRSALIAAEQSMKGAVRREVSRLMRDIRLGHSIEDAFQNWGERRPIPAVRDMGLCVQLSAQSGGNLADALERHGEAVRQQLAIAAKARALTAQGRLQALVMLAMPPLLLLVTAAMDPFVTDFFFKTAMGQTLLLMVLALEVTGWLWIRRLVRVL
jgi:tight adherence protein B